MGKTTIHISCIDQQLIPVASPVLASGGQNEDAVLFTFCPLWADYTKVAVFYREGDTAYHVPVVDDRCVIPHEVLMEEGYIYIGVFGQKGDATRTTEVMRYRVVKGALTEGTVPSDPTPELYEQILAACQEVLDGLDGRFAAVDERVEELARTVESGTEHEHDASNITSGTLAVEHGGTGADNAAAARENLGITLENLGGAPADHTHDAGDFFDGALAVENGGTGADNAADARENLGVTLENLGGAPAEHGHDAAEIISGALPVERGGTGAGDAEEARINLGAAASTHTHAESDIITPEWVPLTPTNGTTPGNVGGALRYRKIGNHVYITGTVNLAASSDGSVLIFTMPEGLRPIASVYKIAAVGSQRIGRLYMTAAGNFNLEWIVTIKDGSTYTKEGWIDCTFDYWTD